jgi:NADH-quinone oxidoreductase subunit L
MLPDSLLIFIVLAPGLAALSGLAHKLVGDRVVMLITTGVVGTAGIMSLVQLFMWTFGGYGAPDAAHIADTGEHAAAAGRHVITLLPFIDVGAFQANWAIRVDTLSVVMLAVVTSVSALVHLYSWGYMSEERHKARFFAYLSLFTFAMLMLVTADNFMQLFFGWEGVGLASYLLIGFWYQKASANDAAIKAFVTNRVGDVGLALGIMVVFCVFGTVEFAPMLEAIRTNAVVTPLAFAQEGEVRSLAFSFLGQRVYAIELIGILLFIGAMGKSAQFFLHVWLPDAMEGPTPVSALIHAATMVTAGVYLVCLMSPIYEYAPIAAGMVTLIGAVTALYAATVGLAQNDIKRVIAYSTCSQLGYMFFAAGIGAYQAAMFHLFTHAFFKALLFLGAGSVIHGMHHEQDMRRMGGVARFMPVTHAVMLIGTLAIIGLGIPQTQIGFAGFFSKDAILETTYAAGETGKLFAMVAFGVGIVAALLTSFYSWRLIFMTFYGPRAQAHHNDHAHDGHAGHDHAHDNGHDHVPHESPLVMLVPLVLLAIGAVFAGFVFYDPMVGHHAKEFWGEAIYTAKSNTVLKDKYDVPVWVLWAPLVVTLTGLLVAVATYVFNRGFGARLAARGGPLHALFSNKWYFDEIYQATFVRATKGLGDLFWKVGDKRLIDGLGPNGVAGLVRGVSATLSRMHSGYLYHYAFVIIGAAIVFGGVMLFLVQGGR